jgi:hypothetical protein
MAELLERRLEWRPTVRPIAPTTVSSYRAAMDRYILPALGKLPVRQVDAATLDAFYAHLRTRGGKDGRPLKASTVHEAGRSPLGPRTRPAAQPADPGGVAAGSAGGPGAAGNDGRPPGRWPPLPGGGAAAAPAGGPGQPCGPGSRPGRRAGRAAGGAGSSPPPGDGRPATAYGKGRRLPWSTKALHGQPATTQEGGPWRSSTPPRTAAWWLR